MACGCNPVISNSTRFSHKPLLKIFYYRGPLTNSTPFLSFPIMVDKYNYRKLEMKSIFASWTIWDEATDPPPPVGTWNH